ncbi:hypothetical protein DL767_011349 [Monosporascus sp. MG133]|nr:hypothetical protein DL767_011349 [Monosporascus sp. MG133]
MDESTWSCPPFTTNPTSQQGVKRLRNESLGPPEQVEAHRRQRIALTWGPGRLEDALASQCCRNNPSTTEEQQPWPRRGPERHSEWSPGRRPQWKPTIGPIAALGTQSQGFNDDDEKPSPSPPKKCGRPRGTIKLPQATVESEDEEPPISAEKRRRRSRSATMVGKGYTYGVPEDCQDTNDSSEAKKCGGIQ